MYRTRTAFPSTLHRQFNRLQDEFDRIFGHSSRATFPPLNVWGDDERFYVEAELPGFAPEQLEIVVNEGDLLTIAGERREADTESGEYHRRERATGKFRRTIRLPEEVDSDSVEATLANGILTVTLAKRAENRPRSIQVKVK